MSQRPAIGAIGRTLSALAPDGQADFDGAVFEVRAEGGSNIDPQRHVLVTGFDPQLVLVREATPEEAATGTPSPVPALEKIEPPIETAAELDQKLKQLTPYVPVTMTILAANVVVFGMMVANGVDLMEPDAETLLR